MAPPNPSAEIEEDWYAHAFDALYPIVYAHRSIASARHDVEFAIEKLQVSRRHRVLDLCCGNGRHMVHLLRSTPSVTGLDFSAALLRYAREKVGKNAQLIRADMRSLPFTAAFDVILNFFTSFGYFMEQTEDEAVLDSLACALRPRGRFFIDYLNPEYVKKNLVPRSSKKVDGYDICEERWIDSEANRINKVTAITTPEGKLVRTSESVRLYTPAQMLAMAQRAGLEVAEVYGDYEGQPFHAGNPRMILTGQKAADA